MEAIAGLIAICLGAVVLAVLMGRAAGRSEAKREQAEAQRKASENARSDFDRASVEFDNRRPLE